MKVLGSIEWRAFTLTCQISSESVHCVGFRWPKTTIFGNFWHLGGSCIDPFYRCGPNLSSYSRPEVYTCTLNFIWMCSLYWLPVAKNHNFRQILTLGGAPMYRAPLTDEGQI